MLHLLRNLLFPTQNPDIHCLNVGQGIFNTVGNDQINIYNYYFWGGRSTSSERNDVIPFSLDVGTPEKGKAFMSKYSPLLWRPPFDNLPITIELIDKLYTTLNPSDAHAISELNAELNELRKTLENVWDAVQHYKDSPLFQSLNLTINPWLMRCHLRLFHLYTEADHYRHSLESTRICGYWPEVFRWGCERRTLVSMKNELLVCRRTFEVFSLAFESVGWMQLGNELRSGPVPSRRVFTSMRQNSPSFGPSVESLIIEDHLGSNLSIPIIFCSTWEGLDYMVKAYTKGRMGDNYVERGDYRILQAQDSRTLSPSEFEERVQPGMAIEMSIVLRQRITSQEPQMQCPRCQLVGPTINNELDDWVECGYCSTRLQFATLEDDSGDGFVPEDDYGENGEDGSSIDQDGDQDNEHEEIVSPASQAEVLGKTRNKRDVSGFRRIHVVCTVAINTPTLPDVITSDAVTPNRARGKHVRFTETNTVYSHPTASPTWSEESLPSSDGPMTPPPINIPLPSILVRIHPLLGFDTNSPLDFDLNSHPSLITTTATFIKSSYSRQPPTPHVLAEPATTPPLPSISLIADKFPWKLISHSTTSPYVTVSDVLYTLHNSVRVYVSAEEYNSLPPNDRLRIREAYKSRMSAESEPQKEGLRKIDFLVGRKFLGLSRTDLGPDVWFVNVE